jgi:hypothetical protein
METGGQPECPPGALLGAALALLKAPERWICGHLAVDARGRAVQAADDGAVAWSGIGAVLRAASLYRLSRHSGPFLTALACLRRAVGAADLFAWDGDAGRSHPEILDGFRRAIVLAHAVELDRSERSAA